MAKMLTSPAQLALLENKLEQLKTQIEVIPSLTKSERQLIPLINKIQELIHAINHEIGSMGNFNNYILYMMTILISYVVEKTIEKIKTYFEHKYICMDK
jgi:hypothetical protein